MASLSTIVEFGIVMNINCNNGENEKEDEEVAIGKEGDANDNEIEAIDITNIERTFFD